MKQWGRYVPQNESLGYRITLPIPYTDTTTYIVVCSNDDTSNGYVTTSAARRHSNQNIDLVSGLSGDYYQSQPVDIIVCGWQQWGKSSSSGRATTTVTLPISMASAIYAVAISQAAASDTWSTWSSIVSNTQIKLTNNYGPGSWWLVTGKQQWGNTQAASNNFPIAFPSTCYAVIPTEYVTWNIEGNTSLFGNISRTGFTCYNLDRRKYYVAVGI